MAKTGEVRSGDQKFAKSWLAEKQEQFYPCLCEAIDWVLFWNRILGILPVVNLKVPHVSACKFAISRGWLVYSYILQAVFTSYTVTTATLRMSCGPGSSSGSDWYVMTIGYAISDVDAAVILICGTAGAKTLCKVLAIFTTIPGPIGEMRRVKKLMRASLVLVFLGFATVFLSFSYVAWVRLTSHRKLDLYCHMLDQPLGVMVRGSTNVFSGIYISLIMVLCLLLSSKFERLADTTKFTLETYTDGFHSNFALEQSPVGVTGQGLYQLAEIHRKATTCLKLINKSVGFQVLAEVSANLYTIVYYLYRYSTASHETVTSNNQEKGHYIIALGYRIAKLLCYITLGHMVTTSASKPVEVLRRARIINLPTRLQQQVQSLILQWSGKRMALSAFGIVDVGPWLMAPIIGNIITYLLVALQFERPPPNGLSPNVTAILESIF